MSARIFIRNDDVITLDARFRYFFDLAMDHGLPVVHAVIPGKMDQRLVRFLCQAKERTPQMLDIVQHGWIHANHSSIDDKKYEFGPSRDYKAQQEDITQGLKKMRQAFGKNFTSAFVPPYHGYNEDTRQVLFEEKFRIFSAGAGRPDLKKRCIEFPAQVSFTSYDQQTKKVRSAREMLGAVLQGIHRRSLTGILAHHEDFSTVLSRRQLALFFDYIAGLKANEGWRVLLFSEL